MLRSALCAISVLTIALAAAPVAAQNKEAEANDSSKPQVTPGRLSRQAREAEIERTIRAQAVEFTEAFNRGDVKTLAAQFAADAEYISADGSVVEGSDAILEQFQAGWRETPGRILQIRVDQVRSIGSDIAIEDGVSLMTTPGQPDELMRYTVLHVKSESGWKIRRVQDATLSEPSAAERLQELAWMIGSWVDEQPDALVETDCRWAAGGHFIVRTYRVRMPGRPVQEGTSRVGWDPQRKQFRTWVFGADGAFAEGFWTRVGEDWIVKQTGVLADGSSASATQILTPVDQDSFLFQAVDRIVGGELLEDTAPVKIVRRPPAPAINATTLDPPAGENSNP